MTVEQIKNISEEESIKMKIDNLKEKYNNFLSILEEYKLTFSNNLQDILNEYKESIFKKVFSKDTLANIEYQNSLNPEEYKITYIAKNNLNRNEKIENSYLNLKVALKDLNIDNIDSDFILKITYFSFDGTPYQRFLTKEVFDFQQEWDKYFQDSHSSEDLRILIRDKKFRADQKFYEYSYSQMMNGNNDYFFTVKQEDYSIKNNSNV